MLVPLLYESPNAMYQRLNATKKFKNIKNISYKNTNQVEKVLKTKT